MQATWSKILVPVTVVGLALLETLGFDSRRPESHVSSYSAVKAVSKEEIMISPEDTTKKKKTPPPPKKEVIDWGDDDDLFLTADSPADTIPAITARDTMKVPDSLKLTDPFLYQWYVAVKDSLVHRIVVDSLKKDGDSLIWPVIDSLYLRDSATVAKEKYDRWYNSLSKAERKRVDYQKKLPKLLHEQDSILARKDSIRKAKDSIIETTPRILDTPFLPDSLQYKRFVSWRHDREFNRIETFEWDTTFNYHFNDYPFRKEDVGAAWLGMAGSAVQTFNFLKRDKTESVSFYEPYESWTYTPSSLPMYNTKTPYTELMYYGTLLSPSMKESNNLRLFTTQNILPQLNIALEYKRYGGSGILNNESTDNRTSVVSGNWLGKRYVAHAGLIHNTIKRKENGGVRDNMWVRDTLVEVREIDVNLNSSANEYKKNTIFFDQSYRIPFVFIKKFQDRKIVKAELAYRDSVTATGDSAAIADMDTLLLGNAARREAYYASLDTLDDITTAFIGTSSEYSVYNKIYTDEISASDASGSAFFNNNFFINPRKSVDSLHMMKLDNKIFLRVQPWSEDGVISKIEGGIGDRFLSHYMASPGGYIRNNSNVRWNSLYAYAGVEGKLLNSIEWNALGEYTFLGDQINDMFIGANAKMTLHPFRRHKKSPVVIKAAFETSLKEPDWFQQHMYTNHYMWDNSFSKTSLSKINGSIDIPKWRLSAGGGYSLVANKVWYDTLGMARQCGDAVSVITGYLRKDFALFNDFLHLDNSVLVQYSSNQEVIPLPLVALNLKYFIQFNIVRKDVMQMQIGANTRMTTKWYAPSYNPVSGTFMAQNEYQYGYCPIFDLFMNVQWKRACIFVKWENAGRGWPMKKRDYFSAHHYISTDRQIKVGIYWPFYVMSGTQKTMSSKAGSGMSGGSGGGGGFGGLTSSLGRGGR